jgi:hypothetical protein
MKARRVNENDEAQLDIVNNNSMIEVFLYFSCHFPPLSSLLRPDRKPPETHSAAIPKYAKERFCNYDLILETTVSI